MEDMFAKIQNLVAFLLVGSMVVMGAIGMLGLGTGHMVHQPLSMARDFKDVVSMAAVAFWLFIGAEYVIPVSKDVKNAKRNVPLGMMIDLSVLYSLSWYLAFIITPTGMNLQTQQHRICYMVTICWEPVEKSG